jgi:hypothetical protein
MLGFCRGGSRGNLLAHYTPLALVDIRALIRGSAPVRAVEAVSVIAADRRYYAVTSGAIAAAKAPLRGTRRTAVRPAAVRAAGPRHILAWTGKI